MALLLTACLFVIVWRLIHSPEPLPSEPEIVPVVLVPPPPQRPPEPAKEMAQRTLQAPPPVPVPPKKLVEDRRDSVPEAPAPTPKRARPLPKTRAPDVANPLSLDEPPDWRQTAPPQGDNAGYMIGGNGDNGGGSGCGDASVYLALLSSQLRDVFTRNADMNSRNFRVQAQLWFDDMGSVQRSQLMQSTGDTALDVAVRKLLKGLNAGRGMPQCFQPITVWVSQPWTDVVPDESQSLQSHMDVWQTPRHP
ncbi:MAG: hypothetical protein AB1508_06355 [Pseudomonadota bacterium]